MKEMMKEYVHHAEKIKVLCTKPLGVLKENH
jgi:hypothetical protein